VLEENAPVICDQHIDDMDSNFIQDENVVAPNFESEKQKMSYLNILIKRNDLRITILSQLLVLHSYGYKEDVRKWTMD